jgi:hypothetical protein
MILRPDALGRDAVSEQIKVSRPELYKQVWSEPMTKVAAQYWISDVGLKKRCKAMGIPTPPRGYWAKVAQGRKPSIKPLPAASGKPEGTVFYRPKLVHKRPNVPLLMEPADFDRPLHPLVQESVSLLQKNTHDWRRLPALEIYVKPWRLERPATLLSALFYAVERQGHKVAIARKDDSYSSMFLVEGESLNFYVTEELRYRSSPESKDGDSTRPNVQVQALEFHFRLWRCPHEGRTNWKDSRRLPLEGQLNEILAELIPLSASIRSGRLKLEQQESERAENEKRLQAAKDQLETLRRDIQGYRFAEEVRTFAARTKQFYEGREDSESFSNWEKWAKAVADQSDPFVARRKNPLARYFKLHDQLWRLVDEDPC